MSLTGGLIERPRLLRKLDVFNPGGSVVKWVTHSRGVIKLRCGVRVVSLEDPADSIIHCIDHDYPKGIMPEV